MGWDTDCVDLAADLPDECGDTPACAADNPQVCYLPNCEVPGFCNPFLEEPVTGCNDVACCQQVAAIDPACADEDDANGWDVYCAAIANVVCAPAAYPQFTPGTPYDPCFFDPNSPDFIDDIFQPEDVPVWATVQQGSCLTPHGGHGCNKPECCAAICSVDPGCCNDGWDAACANLARSGVVAACESGTTSEGPSPDLTPQVHPSGLQGYQFYTQGGTRGSRLLPAAELDEVWLGAVLSDPTQGIYDFGFSAH